MIARRVLPALALAGVLCTCAEPAAGPGGPGLASVAIQAVAPPSLRVPTLVIEQVKATLTRSSNSDNVKVLDSRTVPFGVNAASVSISLTALIVGTEVLNLELEYQTAAGVTLFFAGGPVTVSAGSSASVSPGQPFYVGPGSNTAFLALTPLDSSLSLGDSLAYDVTAFDASQQPVPDFYVSWSVSDPRVSINALGVVKAPDITKVITVTASTPPPNSVTATTTLALLGTAPLGISPDSVEKLPKGTQQFTVTVGATRGATFLWSVAGVDGGNATVGTIDTAGFYTAPAAVPSPNKFQVCAREQQAPTRAGCATVVITQVPSAGADLIVINDQNIFDAFAMRPDTFPGNARFVRNLVNFTGTGPRANGTVVYYDRGRNSPCFLNGECGDVEKATFDSVITAQGYSIVKIDTVHHFSSIPANVKVLVLWMPLLPYDTTEINTFKQFAAQGGRILFIGERLGFYTATGLALENQFLQDMGAQMTNIGTDLDCGYIEIPSASIRNHPLMTGVNKITIACASAITPGPNDFPLFFDTTNQSVLAAVAKIDLTPLPAPPVPIRAPLVRSPGPVAPVGTGRGN